MYRLWLGPDVEHLKCLTRAAGDGIWGELDDNYFLAAGSTNALAAVFARLASEYGQPAFGGKGKPLPPISDRGLSPELIHALENLPRAEPVKAAAAP
jgi:hypothetical protein